MIVPAKFVDIVKVLPAPDVAVSVDELKLTVKSSDTTFVLHGMDAGRVSGARVWRAEGTVYTF